MKRKLDVNQSVDAINKFSEGTLMEALGIEITEVGEDFLKAKMPVDSRTHQPMKMLHGGASAALMETVGSLGSFLFINPETHYNVGLEVNANHIGSAKSGYVYATGKIVHLGSRTHVWLIDIKNEEGKMISTGRLTNMIIEKKK